MHLNLVAFFQIAIFVVIACTAVYLYFKYGKNTARYSNLNLLNEISEFMDDIYTKREYTEGVSSDNLTSKKPKLKYESECKRIFEKIFKKKFKKIRPKFLENKFTGCNLELDGYCDSIVTPLGTGLAYEYDGKQHKEYTPFFHKNVNDFLYQTKKDELKYWACKKEKILLINIPHTVDFLNLESYIKSRLDFFKVKY